MILPLKNSVVLFIAFLIPHYAKIIFTREFCSTLAKVYGDSVLAGMGISSKLMFIGTFIFMGFAAGCQPLVGFNYGAKNYKRVREIFKTGMTMTFGIGVVLTVIFWFGASELVSFFTSLPDVISQGTIVIRISIFSFLILGPQMLASTGIQAFGKAKESLILSVARQGVVYIPLIFAMESLFGFKGLIWAQPNADAITLGIILVLLAVILNKTTSEKVESAESYTSPKKPAIYEQP